MYEIIFITILSTLLIVQSIYLIIIKGKFEKEIKEQTDNAVAAFIATTKVMTIVCEAIKYFNDKYDVQFAFDINTKDKRVEFTITDPEDGEKIFASESFTKQPEEKEDIPNTPDHA